MWQCIIVVVVVVFFAVLDLYCNVYIISDELLNLLQVFYL